MCTDSVRAANETPLQSWPKVNIPFSLIIKVWCTMNLFHMFELSVKMWCVMMREKTEFVAAIHGYSTRIIHLTQIHVACCLSITFCLKFNNHWSANLVFARQLMRQNKNHYRSFRPSRNRTKRNVLKAGNNFRESISKGNKRQQDYKVNNLVSCLTEKMPSLLIIPQRVPKRN